MRTEPAILVENLTKRFGDFIAVDNVSFRVSAGEVFGWLGPNGAGKTTTIRILLGLLTPTSGSTFVLGLNSATQTKAMHAQVGYMTQQFTLYNDLTAWQNIRFYGGVYGLSGAQLRERIPEIIRMAGLEGRADALTSTLSGGWKQRLALGCAIVHRPNVVFLDEPTAGVDPISRREFWGLIYAMANDGVTVLVTTHYMDEAELCQRIGFISQGRLVALDTPGRLKQTHMRGQVLWPVPSSGGHARPAAPALSQAVLAGQRRIARHTGRGVCDRHPSLSHALGRDRPGDGDGAARRCLHGGRCGGVYARHHHSRPRSNRVGLAGADRAKSRWRMAQL